MDYTEPGNTDPTKKLLSDFNEAKYQILRLHNIWLNCNLLSCAGNLIEWNWKLDSAWRELRKDAKDLDGNKEKEEGDENSFFNRIETINKQIAKNKSDKQELYKTIMEKEMILRELQDVSGKGSKKKRQDEDLMD